MDSARDFYLIGESVPQVRVSVRTLTLHLRMTPVWIESCALKVCHRAVHFLGWCDGVMDSVCNFDLLGESVPQL